jgi:hypothetical protein
VTRAAGEQCADPDELRDRLRIQDTRWHHEHDRADHQGLPGDVVVGALRLPEPVRAAPRLLARALPARALPDQVARGSMRLAANVTSAEARGEVELAEVQRRQAPLAVWVVNKLKVARRCANS